MTFPRLSSRIIALSAALAVLLTTITCIEYHLKVIRTNHFGEIENFYRTVRDRNDKPYSGPEEDITSGLKNILCLDVFSSGFFLMFNEVPLNMESEEDIDKLRRLDSKLAQQLYPKSYVNPTTRTTVIVPRNSLAEYDYLTEYVFMCPILNRNTQKIDVIYLSEAYKLNEDIFGRFLFISQNGKLILMGVAEEPATVKTTKPEDFELAYIEKRGNHKERSAAVNEEKDDPICRQSTDKKIEICSSILNSKHFEDSLIFYPVPSSVGEICQRWKIGYHLTDGSVPTETEEWMLRCDAQLLNSKPGGGSEVGEESSNGAHQKTFYVSRAYDGPGRVLLFTLNAENNRMYLEGLRISNVINMKE